MSRFKVTKSDNPKLTHKQIAQQLGYSVSTGKRYRVQTSTTSSYMKELVLNIKRTRRINMHTQKYSVNTTQTKGGKSEDNRFFCEENIAKAFKID